jgi:plastocyanin
MRSGGLLAVACCALLLVAGCGSSSRQPAGTSAGVPAGARTGTTTSGSFKPAGSAPEVVKVAATPKFASPSPSAPVQSGTVQIAYRNITIEPDTVRVKVGSTIRWTNYDSEQANVTSVGGPQRIASKDFGEGGTFEVKVDAPGVIHYVCTLYPVTMNGTIEVVS